MLLGIKTISFFLELSTSLFCFAMYPLYLISFAALLKNSSLSLEIFRSSLISLGLRSVLLSKSSPVVAVVIAALIDFDLLGRMPNGATDSGIPQTAIAYLVGAVGSGLAGFIGMSIAVRANTRTAVAAQSKENGLNAGLRVAFNSGAVMGVSVVGIALLGVTLMFVAFTDASIVAGFGFGASSIALFARVGGGIYTKAADVGADLVGKVEQGIPEDDPRNPATIADNVGDNVGDVAGMGADLFESYVGSIIATVALAAAGASTLSTGESELILFPLLVSSIGIVASIIGTFLVRTGEGASMGRLLWSLRIGIFSSGALVLIGTAAAIILLELDFNLFWVVLVGLVAGQLIGTASEYYTSYEYSPTRKLADQAKKVLGDNPVYITFDLDCLDTSIAPGVANLEAGSRGFNIDEAVGLIHSTRHLNVIGGDIV